MGTIANAPKIATGERPVKKPVPTPEQRCTEILKRAALQKKIDDAGLDRIVALGNSLKVFIQS